MPRTILLTNLDGKRECRRDLLHAFGAEHVADETPVLGIVSRFATQKGFDLIAQIAPKLLAEDVLLIALGTGEPYYEGLFRAIHDQYESKASIKIAYDNTLAHKVEAGADIFLMPSRYEPCGLNQIYSMKYGTVPVVHATGGLDDTVDEWNAETQNGTGFKFAADTPEDFYLALERALNVFRNDKQSWTKDYAERHGEALFVGKASCANMSRFTGILLDGGVKHRYTQRRKSPACRAFRVYCVGFRRWSSRNTR